MSNILWKAVQADFQTSKAPEETIKREESFIVKRRKFLPDLRVRRTVEYRVGETYFNHDYTEIESKVFESYQDAADFVDKHWQGRGFVKSVEK